MRYGPRRDYSPAVFAYGLMASAISAGACLARGDALVPSALGALTAFAAGFLVMGLGFALFLRGAPRVPAAGQTVLAQTETIFGPIWVWLAFGETPAVTTLIGGADHSGGGRLDGRRRGRPADGAGGEIGLKTRRARHGFDNRTGRRCRRRASSGPAGPPDSWARASTFPPGTRPRTPEARRSRRSTRRGRRWPDAGSRRAQVPHG